MLPLVYTVVWVVGLILVALALAAAALVVWDRHDQHYFGRHTRAAVRERRALDGAVVLADAAARGRLEDLSGLEDIP